MRAAGDVDRAAKLLEVQPSDIRDWLEGLAAPPLEIFMKAIDLKKRLARK